MNPRPTAYEAAAPPLSYRGTVVAVIGFVFKRNLEKLGPGDDAFLFEFLKVFFWFA